VHTKFDIDVFFVFFYLTDYKLPLNWQDRNPCLNGAVVIMVVLSTEDYRLMFPVFFSPKTIILT